MGAHFGILWTLEFVHAEAPVA